MYPLTFSPLNTLRELTGRRWKLTPGTGLLCEEESGKVVDALEAIKKIEDGRDLVRSVLDGTFNGGILGGQAGVGKTISVIQYVLDEYNLKLGTDYLEFTGKVSLSRLTDYLIANPTKIFIFDDSDDMWNDKSGAYVNIFKGALGPKQKWSYEVKKAGQKELRPGEQTGTYSFTGKMLMITNYLKPELVSFGGAPILSRCPFKDMSVAREPLAIYIATIANNLVPEVPLEDKIQTLKWVFDNQEEFPILSIRSVENVIKLKKKFPDNWKDKLDWLS